MCLRALAPLIGGVLIGCVRPTAAPAVSPLETAAATAASPELVVLDGRLESFVARALEANPRLRAALSRWRAARRRIRAEGSWPRPELRYAALPMPIETRVGAQRQRLGIRIPFPSPGARRAAARSAEAMANAVARRHAAEILQVQRQVAHHYWLLWASERRLEVLAEQETLWDSLSEMAQARVATGSATIADVQQIQLRRALLEDDKATEREAQVRHRAELRVLMGESEAELALAAAPPELQDLDIDLETLLEWAAQRPDVLTHDDLASAEEHRAGAARASRLPGFALGVEWMETRAQQGSSATDSGRDALLVALALQLPVDAAASRARADAAMAEAEAHRQDRHALALRARSEVTVAVADLRESRRRAELFEQTLLPQAQTAFESVLGQYQVGGSSVADLAVAARALLDLRLSAQLAQASHAVAWADLEAAVGRPVSQGGTQ